MKSYPVERARHLVLRAGDGDALPADVVRALSEAGVTCGWFRASGVLADVELRVLDPGAGAPKSRRIAGPLHALSIDGSIGRLGPGGASGSEGAEPSIGLHAVLARETDRGMETLAGEIVSARVVALEAFVTAFESLSIARAVDPQANVALFVGPAAAQISADDAERQTLDSSARSAPTPAAAAAAPSASSATAPSWSDTIAASAEQERARQAAANRGALGGAIPARPVKVQRTHDESLIPAPGDVVEHFAFGRAEVVKSDGDRLHLRVGKEGRIREIALEMLNVSPLQSEGPHRRFRLDRRI